MYFAAKNKVYVLCTQETMKLKVKHIAKSFGDNKVLQDVSFSLDAGKVAVLMGTNGSGKTTLFNILSGFLQQDAGELWINKLNISQLSSHEINLLGLSRSFQDMRLIGDLSVTENILFAFSGQQGEKWWKTILPNTKIRQEQQQNLQEANRIMKMCFIEDIADSRASDISYGQQKLLNLACCMANNAKVLLLDEPVAGVNPAYRELLAKLIIELKKQDKSILVIEHNTDFIEAVADRILFLNNGRLSEFDSYAQMKENEIVKEAVV